MADADPEPTYIPGLVEGNELIWGEGYLSPGGPDEVNRILAGHNLHDAEVLDFGSGSGGAALLLARTHGAKRVTGVDLDRPLVERSSARVRALGLDDRVSYRHVDPGPLPFAASSFDVVFTKATIIHITDKLAAFSDLHRVLRPGGWLLGGDWLTGEPGEYDERDLREFVGEHTGFQMVSASETRRTLARAGFTDIHLTDRAAWYRGEVRREIQTLAGPLHDRLIQVRGRDGAEGQLRFWNRMFAALERGVLHPTHLRARKPTA